MKIRIKGSSLRLRLSRPEVDTLLREGEIVEVTQFPNAVFRYSLRRIQAANRIDAAYHDSEMVVMIPGTLIAGWDTDARIGFDAEIPLEGGGSLRVLIEKDFQCLDNTTEDQSQNYPNPKAC